LLESVLKFQIEHLVEGAVPDRLAYLIARQLEPGNFSLSEKSRLGGIRIRTSVSCPRKLKPDGTPDLTFFLFTLMDANEIALMAVGKIVELGE